MSVFGIASSILRFLNPVNKSGNKMASNSKNANYEPTVQDVLSVKKLFLKLIPIELIDQIIDFSEYWPHDTVEIAEEISVHNNGQWLYLQSKPLPGTFIPECGMAMDGVKIGSVPARTLTLGRKVVFRIWSHDQGWSSNDGRGTYQGSFSWFEAILERPLTAEAARSEIPPAGPTDMAGDGLALRQQELGLKTVAVPKKGTELAVKRWHVQSNLHAESETKKHTVVWCWDDIPGSSSKNGAGYGGDFVRSMKTGDRVSIVARAMYPGWENHVEKMEIDVYYAV